VAPALLYALLSALHFAIGGDAASIGNGAALAAPPTSYEIAIELPRCHPANPQVRLIDDDGNLAFSPDAPAPFIPNDILGIRDKERDEVSPRFSLETSVDHLADDRQPPGGARRLHEP